MKITQSPPYQALFHIFSNLFSHKTLTSCVCILSGTARFLNETWLNSELGEKVKEGLCRILKKINPCVELNWPLHLFLLLARGKSVN